MEWNLIAKFSAKASEMIIQDFEKMVSVSPNAVVLLEGRGGISEADAMAARDFGEFLARRFPALRFRSGNSEGVAMACRALANFSNGASHLKLGPTRRLALHDSPHCFSGYHDIFHPTNS
ncbi:MAG: hypothetical protein ACKOLA_00105 [Spartobacteria bacterium]